MAHRWTKIGPRLLARSAVRRADCASRVPQRVVADQWSVGLSDKAAHTREHRLILEVLRLLLQYDHLDGSSLASGELLLRRLYRIELAVRKSPKSPDFEGLEFLLETAVDASGAAVLPSIAK